MKRRRIGVLTGGGDCAGLNPAIKWVVKTALDDRLQAERGIQCEVIGIHDGWKGLLFDETTQEEYITPLTREMVNTWDRYGGTMLGTTRTNPYEKGKDRSRLVLNNIGKLGLDALVIIGGEDTLGVACKLAREGVNVIGIPKTIDKDLSETDYTLGFDTALNVITEEVDKLRTTAGSHKRIFVLETMGRYAGWLALEGGESAGAYIILIPEYDFSVDKVNELVMEGKAAGARYNIIMAAEGAKPAGGREFVKGEVADDFGHKPLGGIAEYLAEQIRKATGLDSRGIVLGYIQRGGAPSAYDRRMGRYFGIAAVDLVVAEDFGKMVCFKAGKIACCDIQNVVGRLSLVNTETQYDIERYNGRRTIFYRKEEKSKVPADSKRC
ncbi:MAG: ATP-dependent 6-phosphofructokinase [Chloroflexi bacterium]|nr:ATP-dependent 6-phosphofructokinase [Chloroflexota bacterium]